MSASTPSAASNSSLPSRTRKATLAGALYFARDEVGDCNKFTQGLAAACAARGVQCRLARPCEQIETVGGRVSAVVTDKGRIAADTVVVAMGSFTAPLLAEARHPRADLSGQGRLDHLPARRLEQRADMPVIDDSKLFGLVPIGERMRISGSAEITGYDTTPATARAEAIIANASFTFPEMTAHLDISKARVWAGLRPVSPPARRSSARPASGACGSTPAMDILAGRCHAARAALLRIWRAVAGLI